MRNRTILNSLYLTGEMDAEIRHIKNSMDFAHTFKLLAMLLVVLNLVACTTPSQDEMASLLGVNNHPSKSDGSGSENSGTSSGESSGTNSISQFSILSGNYQTTALGSPAAQPLKVALVTSAGLPDAGKTVFFTVVGGATHGTTSAISSVTGPDGIAQVTFTAGTQNGTMAVTASTTGQPSLNFTVNVNAVSVYNIAKTGSANGNGQSGGIGSVLAQPYRVVVTDISTGYVVPNVTVRFLANQGVVTGSFSGNTFVDILTDHNGVATSPLMTLNTQSGSYTIRALLAGDPARYTDFLATGTVAANATVDDVLSNLTFSTSTVVADGTQSVKATLLIKDQYGNLIPNNAQTISAVTNPTTSGSNIGTLGVWDTTNWNYVSEGKYERVFSVNTVAGNISVTSLSVGAVNLASTLPSVALVANTTVIPANSNIISTSPSLVADGISSSVIIVTLKDSYNNQVSNGSHTVVVSTNAGTLTSTTLNYFAGSGTYRTNLVAPTSVGTGTATVTLVSVDGTPVVGKTATINLTAGAASSITKTGGDAQSQYRGTLLPTALQVAVKDANNNVIPNVQVDWVVASGDGILSTATSLTDASGLASNTYTLGLTPGTQTVSATVHGTAFTTLFSETAQSVALSSNVWNFNSTNASDLVLSDGSKISLTADHCELNRIYFTDDASNAFSSASLLGVVWDGSKLKLGNNGGCDGSVFECGDLLPQWEHVKNYYTFDGSGSIANGAIVPAAVGGDLTLNTGTSSYVTGKKRQGVTLVSGSNAMNTASAVEATNTYSIAFWIKFNSNAGVGINIPISMLANESLVLNLGFNWNYTGDGLTPKKIYFWQDGSGFAQSSVIPFMQSNDLGWHHVAATYNASGSPKSKFYVDGSLVSTTMDNIAAPLPANSKLWIGGRRADGNGCCNTDATIDEFVLWDTVLTDNEIQKVYNRQQVKFSGQVLSKVFNATESTTWDKLSWVPTLPFFKNIVGGETVANYSSLVGSSGSSGDSNLSTGLVGLWHLDNSYNDSYGNNHFSPSNITFTDSGILGKAASFNGTSSKMISPSINLTSTQAVSVSFWYYSPSTPTGAARTLVEFSENYNAHNDGFVVFHETNGAITCGLLGNANYSMWTSSAAISNNAWNHITCMFDKSLSSNEAKMYINGALAAGSNGGYNGDNTNNFGNYPLYIGARGGTSNWTLGNIDEIALWSRALHANEIKQLYRRGANRIKYQVRSCTSANCADDATNANWKGPDGTSSSFYSELNNVSGGVQNATLPNVPLVSASPSQYVQYKAILESDDPVLSPELKSVSVKSDHYYSAVSTAPSVTTKVGISFYNLTAAVQTLDTGTCSAGVGYQLGYGDNYASVNAGSAWYYFTAGHWVQAGSTASTSNSFTELSASSYAALKQFGNDVGRNKKVFLRAFLKSDGTSTGACELKKFEMNGIN